MQSEEKLRALLDSVASAKSLSAVGSVVSTPEQVCIDMLQVTICWLQSFRHKV